MNSIFHCQEIMIKSNQMEKIIIDIRMNCQILILFILMFKNQKKLINPQIKKIKINHLIMMIIILLILIMLILRKIYLMN